MSTVAQIGHVARADAAVDAARRAAEATSVAARAMRAHRDGLIRATGTGQALADRHYRSFADAVGVPRQPESASTGEDDLAGVYPLVESADQSYAALLAAANAAAGAVLAAEAHRAKLGGSS